MAIVRAYFAVASRLLPDLARRQAERLFTLPPRYAGRHTQSMRLPALFVHDNGDAEVPFEHTLRLSARMPQARLIKTYGLGHHRLLRDHAVVRAIVDFVRGDSDEVPAELPLLPRPAPIY